MARRPAAEKSPNTNPMPNPRHAFQAGQARKFGTQMGEPVTPSNGGAEVIVGQRLRDIRRQKGLTVRALAAQSGLAVNTLSMIENGKTSPSVSTLQILARALGIPMAAFFEQEAVAKKVVYVLHGERPSVKVDTNRLEHLGKDLAGSVVQPYVLTLQPGSSSGQTTVVHTGHEFVYCLSGTVLYTIEEISYPLAPGDSIVFESHLSHCWRNTGRESAQILLVMVPSDVRDAPVERHFPLEPTGSGEAT